MSRHDIQFARSLQASYQMAEAANRAAGSGGGYGFQVMALLGSGSNYDTSYSTSSTTDVIQTGVSASANLARTCFIRVEVTATGKVSGAAGTFGYGTLYIDGTAQTHTIGRQVALWDKQNGFTCCTVSQIVLLQPGDHTFTWQLHVDNAALTYNHYGTLLEVFQLGA